MHPAWLFLLFPVCLSSYAQEDGQFDDFEQFLYSWDDEEKRNTKFDIAKELKVGHCISTKRKSPINIDLGKVTVVSLPPLKFQNYHVSENVSESNSEFNVTAHVHGYSNWTQKPTLSGGPLRADYHLNEIHWDMCRFEDCIRQPFGHTVNNAEHDFEIHFVHTRNDLSVEEAQLVPGGIVIMATFITIHEPSKNTNPVFWNSQPGSFTFIEHSETSKALTNESIFDLPVHPGEKYKWVSPDTFLPVERDIYFNYNGTFSHAPCFGNATWIIFAKPITMTPEEWRGYMRTPKIDKIIKKEPMMGVNFYTLRVMEFLKRRENSEVLFNTRHIEDSPLPTSKKGIILLGVTVAALGIFVIGSFCFNLKWKFGRQNEEDESEDRQHIVNHRIEEDIISFL